MRHLICAIDLVGMDTDHRCRHECSLKLIFSFGFMRFVFPGDHQGVIATTNEALAIDPLNDKARWHRAKSCLEAGDPQQTIDDITEFKLRQKSQLTEANAILKRAQKELNRVPAGFGSGIRGMFNRYRSSDDNGKDDAVVCRRAAHVSYCGLKNEGISRT